ncbi:MAG: hypothetical protein U1E51_03835 [Candidatus Binatia bacterium]|nr:hypothetical protein [Candidatus Binatia bacterium]
MRAAEVPLRRTEDGALGVGEFLLAAVIAAVVDEFLGGRKVVLRGFSRERFLAEKEAGTLKVNAGTPQRLP